MRMDLTEVYWRRCTRIQPVPQCDKKEDDVLEGLDILSLRSSVIHLREEALYGQEDLRSKVQILWQIGSNVLRRYELGNDCIEMMEMLAYFDSTAVCARLLHSEQTQSVILMLKDLGFLTMKIYHSPPTIIISTHFPALVDEIREKNVPIDVEFLRKIITLLCSSRTLEMRDGRPWHKRMTPIWKHALTHTHGIEFIRDNTFRWEDYLKDLLEYQRHDLRDGQNEVLISAVEIFEVEYGNLGWKTMKLRFTQIRLLLREELKTNEEVEILLNHSSHYRPLLETYFMTNHEPWEHYGNGVIARYAPNNPMNRQQQLAELFYDKALEMRDVNSKTLLLEEALVYCTLGNNVWRSTISDNYGDMCFSCRLKCLIQLGRWDEMVAVVREIKDILMRQSFCIAIPWFPYAILEPTQENDGNEIILNELIIFLNHIFDVGRIGIWEEEYWIKSLMKCECGLRNWDRILVFMREKREFWRAEISRCRADELETWVGLESTVMHLVGNSTDDLVDELVNESLTFTKQLVEFCVNNGTYQEENRVDRSAISGFKHDPLVHVIKTCLVKRRHEELLSYMLEYEKLLEDKYGDRVGRITNGVLVFGVLLFGECVRGQLVDPINIDGKVVELLQGVKAKTQNQMSILSNHPTEEKSWMESYADLIYRSCDLVLRSSSN